MRLLVLDTIHGGRELAGYLREQGHFVDAVDVYRNSSVIDAETALHRDYDLVIAPVHLPARHPLLKGLTVPVISHHQAVRWILGNRVPSPMVEITGMRGKTTTASAFTELMDGPGILNISAGMFRYPEKEKIGPGSITPAAIVHASREALRIGGWLVAEISLGFIGSGDLGILTSKDDYLIAGKTRHAFLEKVRSGQGMAPLVVAPAISMPGALSCTDVVAIDGDSCSCLKQRDSMGFRNPLLLLDAYRTPLMLAAAAGCLLSRDISRLSSFKAIPGRMSSSWEGDVLTVDNSNSGTNAEGACTAAEYARKICGDVPLVMVIGKEVGAVCEGFPATDVETAIRKIKPQHAIIVGESYERIAAPEGTALYRARTLAEGLDKARSSASRGCIVLAVKCWR
jgi:UDP-N-acetylmuramoylalanine-D-glutamate ligase